MALTVFAGGVLALAATGVASLRLETMADRRQRAAALVLERIEQLRSGGCATDAGADSAPGVAAHWRLDRSVRLTELSDSVLIHERAGHAPRRERVRGAVPC